MGLSLACVCVCVCVCVQPANVRHGMVNIRSDDDLSPSEVLSSYEEKHAREVINMKNDPNVSDVCARAHTDQ